MPEPIGKLLLISLVGLYASAFSLVFLGSIDAWPGRVIRDFVSGWNFACSAWATSSLRCRAWRLLAR